MDQQVSELELSMVAQAPATAVVPPMADAASVMPSDNTGVMAVGNPVVDAKRVTIYADKISPVSFDDSEAVAAFDVVFCVGVSCEDGKTKTYQVVKRIGIDKQRIAAEAERSAPVTVVESKQTTINEQQKVDAVKRARRLAGLD